jgi:hypothetical protein
MVLDRFSCRARWPSSPAATPAWARAWRARWRRPAPTWSASTSSPRRRPNARCTNPGRRFLDVRANLADIGCIEGLVLRQALAFRGHVDILVNNAGIIRRDDAIKFSEKDWDDVSTST